MFVLLFGLMGVAAIFPVGNHYAARSDQLDRGSGLAEAALSELKTRGLLQPRLWIDVGLNKAMINPANGNFEQLTLPQGPGHAFVLDPVGAAETSNFVAGYFPYNADFATTNGNPWNSGALPLAGNKWPIRRVTLPQNMYAPPNNSPKLTSRLAEGVFRLRDDLTNTLPEANDRPGQLRWETLDVNNSPNNPYDDQALARAYAGSYSWFATVLPKSYDALLGMQPSHPRYGSFQYEVSVAVVFKRDGVPGVDTERMLQADLGLGGDLVLYADTGNASDDYDAVEAAMQDITAGQWALVTGVDPTTGQFLMKWYRLLAVDSETDQGQNGNGVPIFGTNRNAIRHAMLEGVNVDDPFTRTSNTTGNIQGLRVTLIPGVIGVATQTLELETN